jgi:amino acid transporter
MIVIGCALTVFTMAGAGRSATGSAALTVIKLALLAAVALAGLALPAAPAAVPNSPAHPATALVLLFFAFVGFERPTAMAGEAVSAQRTLPVALVGGMLGVTLLYAALFAACLRGVPGLATSTNPIQDLATRALGSTGGAVASVGAALIVLGTLASQWITAPRLLLALARDRTLPAPLATLSGRRRTPDLAIIATGATAMLLALNGSFVGGLAASSASRLLIFLTCAGAVLRLGGRDAPPSRFHLPGRTAIAFAVVVACAALLVSAAAELVHLTIILCVGGFLWLSTILTRRSA